MRPAALRRGMSEKLRFVLVRGLPTAPEVSSSAATHGRGALFIILMPSITSGRFSPSIGMRSATVPSVAKSTKSRQR